jgi:hypothetical protein
MAVGYFPAVLADLTARAQSGGKAVAFDSSACTTANMCV